MAPRARPTQVLLHRRAAQLLRPREVPQRRSPSWRGGAVGDRWHAAGVQSYPYGEVALVLDCLDLDRCAEFWSSALGYRRAGGAEPYLSLVPDGGRTGVELLLQRVPEDKHGKNRLHLDLRTPDLGAEVERLRALGARVLTPQPVVEGGWTWHVLADPEGNELCVLQPPTVRDLRDGAEDVG